MDEIIDTEHSVVEKPATEELAELQLEEHKAAEVAEEINERTRLETLEGEVWELKTKIQELSTLTAKSETTEELEPETTEETPTIVHVDEVDPVEPKTPNRSFLARMMRQ